MTVGSLDPAAILDYATKNLRIERILIQVGLDPNNITYDAIFNRLLDLALVNITFANVLALIGGIFLISTFVVRTIVPMRVLCIISIVFFLGSAALAGSVPKFLMYFLALPVNVVRLVQIRNLVRRARSSAQGTLSLDWLRPYMTPRYHQKGDLLFRKGDEATEMLLTVSGKFLVTEIRIEIPPDRILGELGFLSPNNHRTQSVECIEDGEVLTITYDKLLELYMQNPEFGYYFLRLTSDRLLQNHARLDRLVEQSKAELAAAKAAGGGPGQASDPPEGTKPVTVAGPPSSRMQSAAAGAAAVLSLAEIDAALRRRAIAIVERHANYSAASGFIPLPIANEAAVMAVIVRMVRALGEVYDKPLDRNRAYGVAVGLMGGVLPTRLATLASSTAIYLVPGANFIGLAVSSMTASAYARKIGRMLVDQFDREAALERARLALEQAQRSNAWFSRLARSYRQKRQTALDYGLRRGWLRRSA
jgi:CRP-like cAMP-binding protein